ncbi:unnamed protein product [Rotaria sordida]|uniref:Uncharacterized protein n=1 Tax=Rotaria sordida TaxID=392033 RepID=A0A814H627_9BILA|nr:unnamed protein product [Rotaria sordida]
MAQLLIHLEQDQHNHYINNNQSFSPLMTASIYHQQQHQNRSSIQSQTYASIPQIPTQRQQPPVEKDQNHIYLKNILTSFSNKIEHRLQQFEERLINVEYFLKYQRLFFE